MTSKEAIDVLAILANLDSCSGYPNAVRALRMGAEALERVVTLEVQEMRVKARAWDLASEKKPSVTFCDDCDRRMCNPSDHGCHSCIMKWAIAQAREEIEKEAKG